MTSLEVFEQVNAIMGGRLTRDSDIIPDPGSAEITEVVSSPEPEQTDSNGEPIRWYLSVPNGHPHPEGTVESRDAASPSSMAETRDGIGLGDHGGSIDDGTAAEQQTWISTVKKIVQFTDLRNNERVVPIEKFGPERQKRIRKQQEIDGQFNEYAMLLRKIMSVDLRLKEYRLEIQSRGLREVFKKIAKPFRELDCDASPILIRFPFRCLFFLRHDLQEAQKTDIPRATKDDIAQLLDFIESEPVLKSAVQEYEETVSKGKVKEDMAWILFRPHEMAYYKRPLGENSRHYREGCGIVENVAVSRPAGQNTTLIQVNLAVGHHTGRRFGLIRVSGALRGLTENIVEINKDNFSIIPMRFLTKNDQERIRSQMVERGQKYVRLCKADFTMLHYKGPVVVTSNAREKMLAGFGTSNDGFDTSWEVGRFPSS